MGWTLRRKLFFLIFAVIFLALAGSSYFFLNLYQSDRLSSLFEGEKLNTQRSAKQLDGLMTLAKFIAFDRVSESKEVIFVSDNVCNEKNRSLASARYYRSHFKELGLTPLHWLNAKEVSVACQRIEKAGTLIVPSSIQLIVPYITLMIRMSDGSIRFAMLSLDGFSPMPGNTFFLMGRSGRPLWSSDGISFAEKALKDAGIGTQIKRLTENVIQSGASRTVEYGTEGILSYSPLRRWVLYSLAYKPTVMRPINFAFAQALLLSMGFLFLCLLIGRIMAAIFTKPLNELKESTERVGKGDYNHRFEKLGHDEFSTVKKAFNTMMQKVLDQIESTREKANLEKDLDVAQQVQKMFIPNKEVKIGNFHVSSFLKSAARCGGDWWGYYEIPKPEGRPLFGLMVGDVTGHGTASALVTATVRGGLSILSFWIQKNPDIGRDPCNVLTFFNKTIYDATQGNLGMTFFSAVFDVDEGVVQVANAGHVLPFLLRKNGNDTEMKRIGRGGVPLGDHEDTSYREIDTFKWHQDSKLFLYTDGLVENIKEDDNVYAKKHLVKSIRKVANKPGRQILDGVLSDWKESVTGMQQDDDVTALVCEMGPIS